MKVLLAEDDPAHRVALDAMLRKDGHTVLVAADGREAVAIFDREQPDLVIMDIMMPHMDGYAATRVIKERSRDRFVPVVFLTSVTEEAALARCVEYGGDDFLTRPCSSVILKAKVDALARIRGIYDVMRFQNEGLSRHRDRVLDEDEFARTVLNRTVGAGCLNTLNIKYQLQPATMLNGDLLLAARTPSGELHFMLGDFTGRGMSAVLGAVPAAEVFYRMTGAGHSLKAIITEMNRKLKRVLPTNLFCSACLLRIDPIERTLLVWNGGLPEALQYRAGAGVCRRFPSRHLPLGVLGVDEFDSSLDAASLAPEDRVYAYTDGLINTTDARGAQFGQDRLESCLSPGSDPDGVFESIHKNLVVFSRGAVQEDDYALVELTGTSVPIPDEHHSVEQYQGATADFKWRISLEMGADYLRQVDPLPELMRMISGRPILGQHKETLFVILQELFSNSLDHGLLKLSSTMKGTSEGFARYYNLRDERLSGLKDGRITLHLEHIPLGERGKVALRLEDSGDGFDYGSEWSALRENKGYSGRGIPLLRSLCQELTYLGNGNTVEVVYGW